MFFDHSKKTTADATASKPTPAEMYAALNQLHQHKAEQNTNLIRTNRDLEEVRNNLLGITLEKLAPRLEDKADNEAFFRQEITQLLMQNIQQTKNYSRWMKNDKSLTLGKLHRLCVSLMPEALVDALVIMRSRPLLKIKQVTHAVDPETSKVSLSVTLRINPRDMTEVAHCLKGLDAPTTKILLADPRIITLAEEEKMEKYVVKHEPKKAPTAIKELYSQAKNLYTDFLAEKMDTTQYEEFKKQVKTLALSPDDEAGKNLTEMINHIEKIQKIVADGRALTEEAKGTEIRRTFS